MGKKVFIAIVLDSKYENFVVYVMSLNSIPLNIHLSCRPQIASLITKKAFIKIFAKYTDLADVFSPDLAFKLSEKTRINNHAIKLINGQ